MKAQSLAELLGAIDPRISDQAHSPQRDDFSELADVTSPQEFCQKLVASREFRQYIMNCVVLNDVPPWLGARIMDHAWGRPPEKLELTGKDGGPLKQVTEVRSVIVEPPSYAEKLAEFAPKHKQSVH